MAKQAKRIQAWTGDRLAAHAVEDAVKLVKANATAKFDESIEIAEGKMKDLNANDVEAAARIIEGSARSMGLQIVEA